MDSFDLDFSQLSDDELAQLMSLGTMDDRQALLAGQLAQAQALRRSNAAQGHSTGLGAGLAGLGDVLNGVRGGLDEKRLQGEQQKLLGEQERLRRLYAERALGARTAPALGAGDLLPSALLGRG